MSDAPVVGRFISPLAQAHSVGCAIVSCAFILLTLELSSVIILVHVFGYMLIHAKGGYMARLTVVLEPALAAEFKRLAAERGHTMSWYVKQAIKEIVDRSHQEEKAKGGGARQAAAKKRK